MIKCSLLSTNIQILCRCSCTAVKHTPRDREVLGLNPTGCWAFFSVSLSHSLYISVLNVPRGGATLQILLEKKLFLAVQLEVKQAL